MYRMSAKGRGAATLGLGFEAFPERLGLIIRAPERPFVKRLQPSFVVGSIPPSGIVGPHQARKDVARIKFSFEKRIVFQHGPDEVEHIRITVLLANEQPDLPARQLVERCFPSAD